MKLSLYAYRFEFRALERLYFAPGAAANAFRGAFGHIFRRMSCRPECPGTKTCEWRRECPYARLFEPEWTEGPSGFADAPRPFVIRAAALDARRFAPGDRFTLDVHVFEQGETLLEYLVLAFLQLAAEGIGAGRGRVAVEAVHALTDSHQVGICVYRDGKGFAPHARTLIEVPLTGTPEPPLEGGIVRFTTPTELKSGGRVIEDAPFRTVFARARDRVGAVAGFYGGEIFQEVFEQGFQAVDRRASAIRTVSSRLKWVSAHRRSSRTGQVHPLGGFVGEVRYEGDLAEFLPILRAAYWTGIGRQTVWGKGVVEVVPIPALVSAT